MNKARMRVWINRAKECGANGSSKSLRAFCQNNAARCRKESV